MNYSADTGEEGKKGKNNFCSGTEPGPSDKFTTHSDPDYAAILVNRKFEHIVLLKPRTYYAKLFTRTEARASAGHVATTSASSHHTFTPYIGLSLQISRFMTRLCKYYFHKNDKTTVCLLRRPTQDARNHSIQVSHSIMALPLSGSRYEK